MLSDGYSASGAVLERWARAGFSFQYLQAQVLQLQELQKIVSWCLVQQFVSELCPGQTRLDC